MSSGCFVPADAGLSCLVMVARYFGVAADAGQLQHQFGQDGKVFGSSEILRASKLLGLKARQVSSDWSRLEHIQFPAIARHTDGHYFVIGGIKEEGDGLKVLVQDPLVHQPLYIDGSVTL